MDNSTPEAPVNGAPLEFGQPLYSGPKGYATLTACSYAGRAGALLHYRNPDPKKLHAVDSQGMRELSAAVAELEKQLAGGAGDGGALPTFLVIYGDYDPIHAGADITEFAGEPDYEALHQHMLNGVELDSRIKRLWPRLRTVGVFCGNRFGGSVEWPLFAEFGVCDSATQVQFSEVHLGIVPGWDGILNILLQCGPENALYMCATGNTLNAAQMHQIGIVESVVDATAGPDRASMSPDDYAAAWKDYAAGRQAALLAAACQHATLDAVDRPAESAGMVSSSELQAELGRRCNPEPYKELRAAIAAEAAVIDKTDVEATKALNKKLIGELNRLGKPLAPHAVETVENFVDRWRGLDRRRLLERFEEIGREEAALIDRLMRSEHRQTGVNAVLSKNPAERVAVFD